MFEALLCLGVQFQECLYKFDQKVNPVSKSESREKGNRKKKIERTMNNESIEIFLNIFKYLKFEENNITLKLFEFKYC